MWTIKPEAIEKYKCLPDEIFFNYDPEHPIVDIDSGVDKNEIKALCDTLLKTSENERQYAPIFTEEQKLHVNLRLRTVHYLYQQEMLDNSPVVQEVVKKIISEIKRHWGVDVEVHDRPYAAGYAPGFFITDHSDNCTTKDGVPIVNNTKRRFTALLYLNTKGVDYDGGQLDFPSIRNESNALLTPSHNAGSLVIFPSNPLFLHGVSKVRWGYRVVLVSFFRTVE